MRGASLVLCLALALPVPAAASAPESALHLSTFVGSSLGPTTTKMDLGFGFGYSPPDAAFTPELLLAKNRAGLGARMQLLPKQGLGVGAGYVRDFSDNRWEPMLYVCLAL